MTKAEMKRAAWAVSDRSVEESDTNENYKKLAEVYGIPYEEIDSENPRFQFLLDCDLGGTMPPFGTNTFKEFNLTEASMLLSEACS